MKRLALVLLLLLASSHVLAAMAVWTGKSRLVQSVTGQPAMNCEYTYAGHLFWRTFAGSCPSSIDVQ